MQVNAYSPETIKISDLEFRRYIKPQVRNIVQGYRSIIKTVKTEDLQLFNNKNELISIYQQTRKITIKCPILLTIECKPEITKILKLLVKSERRVLDDLKTFKINKKNSHSFHKQIEKFYFLNSAYLKMRTYLENVKTSFDLGTKLSSNTLYLLKEHFKFIRFYHETLVLEFIPEAYFKEFKVFWKNFINPLNEKVAMSNNKKYLKFNLSDLNFTINKFHMYFTKINKKTPKKLETQIATIHRRWNNILRLSLH
jgi:hypothetical protein